MSNCPFVYLSNHPSVYLSFLSTDLSVCEPIHLLSSLSVFAAVHPSSYFCLCVHLSIFLSTSLFPSLPTVLSDQRLTNEIGAQKNLRLPPCCVATGEVAREDIAQVLLLQLCNFICKCCKKNLYTNQCCRNGARSLRHSLVRSLRISFLPARPWVQFALLPVRHCSVQKIPGQTSTSEIVACAGFAEQAVST